MDDELLKAKKLAKSLREQTDNFLMTGNRKDDSWKKDGFKFDDDPAVKFALQPEVSV